MEGRCKEEIAYSQISLKADVPEGQLKPDEKKKKGGGRREPSKAAKLSVLGCPLASPSTRTSHSPIFTCNLQSLDHNEVSRSPGHCRTLPMLLTTRCNRQFAPLFHSRPPSPQQPLSSTTPAPRLPASSDTSRDTQWQPGPGGNHNADAVASR